MSPRKNISYRPTTANLLAEMKEHSDLTDSQLFTAGVDSLHFIWSVLRKDGTLLVQMPEDEEPRRVEFFVPGLINRSER